MFVGWFCGFSSFFSTLLFGQIETLDIWDNVYRLCMYSCAGYPGYPDTFGASRLECDESKQGLGWVAAVYFILPEKEGAPRPT